jgi:hypothetical protein
MTGVHVHALSAVASLTTCTSDGRTALDVFELLASPGACRSARSNTARRESLCFPRCGSFLPTAWPP